MRFYRPALSQRKLSVALQENSPHYDSGQIGTLWLAWNLIKWFIAKLGCLAFGQLVN
ncbi:MAG: hypothetical protein IPN76_35355 [Saprospiraceae bacterium]|nr:hypothetical protein [Saprospiraceae bacterium]